MRTKQEENGEPKLAVARAELTLSRDDAFPLRRVPLKPDPIESLAHVASMVDPSQHDALEICLDVLPMTASATRAWRMSHVNDKTDEMMSASPWHQLLWGAQGGQGGQSGRGGQSGPPRLYGLKRADRTREEMLLSKSLANPEPHFQFQLLLRTRSETRGRAVALLQAALAAMNQFDGDNSLRVVGSRRLGGSRFSGSDSMFRRRSFDRRMDKWLFQQRKHNTIGTSEFAGLMKPATTHCRGDRIVRGEEALDRPPKGLITYDFSRPNPNTYFLGAVGKGEKQRVVGVPLEDTLFTYNPGRSRWGKTESNLVRFIELSRTGKCSTLFLDPHADALARVKPWLAELGCADRIVELSIAAGRSTTQIGWNPFSKSNLYGEDAIGQQTQVIVDSIASTMGWGGNKGPRIVAILGEAVKTLLEISAKLPGHLSPTIFQIPTLLRNEAWRESLFPHISNDRVEYWEEYAALSADVKNPLINFISRLDGVKSVKAMLGASESSYNLRDLIDSNKIILVRLRGTGEIDKLIASMIVYDLMRAVMSRAEIPVNERVPIHAYLDEVQEYDAAVKTQIAALVEQTAKYGMRLHLLNQDPAALQPRTLQALLNNRSHLLATAVQNNLSAKQLAISMDTKEVFQSVKKYHGIAQITLNGEQPGSFRYRSIGLEEAYGPDPGTEASNAQLQALIDQNSGRRPVDETLAALETLPTRIVDALQSRDRGQQRLVSPNRTSLGPSPYRPDSVRS